MHYCPKCGKELNETERHVCDEDQRAESPEPVRKRKIIFPILSLALGMIGFMTLFDDSQWDTDAVIGVIVLYVISPIILGIMGIRNGSSVRKLNYAGIILAIITFVAVCCTGMNNAFSKTNEELLECSDNNACFNEMIRRVDSVWIAGTEAEWFTGFINLFPEFSSASLDGKRTDSAMQATYKDTSMTMQRIRNILPDINRCLTDSARKKNFFSTLYAIDTTADIIFRNKYFNYAANSKCDQSYLVEERNTVREAERFINDAVRAGSISTQRRDSLFDMMFHSLSVELFGSEELKSGLGQMSFISDVSVRKAEKGRQINVRIRTPFLQSTTLNTGFLYAAFCMFHFEGSVPFILHPAVDRMMFTVMTNTYDGPLTLASILVTRDALMKYNVAHEGGKTGRVWPKFGDSFITDEVTDLNGVDVFGWCRRNDFYCSLGSLTQREFFANY